MHCSTINRSEVLTNETPGIPLKDVTLHERRQSAQLGCRLLGSICTKLWNRQNEWTVSESRSMVFRGKRWDQTLKMSAFIAYTLYLNKVDLKQCKQEEKKMRSRREPRTAESICCMCSLAGDGLPWLSVGTAGPRGSQSAGSAGSWWKVQLEKSEPGCEPPLPRWMFTFQSVDNEWGMTGGVPLDRGVAGRVLRQHWATELGRGRGWRRWPYFGQK